MVFVAEATRSGTCLSPWEPRGSHDLRRCVRTTSGRIPGVGRVGPTYALVAALHAWSSAAATAAFALTPKQKAAFEGRVSA